MNRGSRSTSSTDAVKSIESVDAASNAFWHPLAEKYSQVRAKATVSGCDSREKVSVSPLECTVHGGVVSALAPALPLETLAPEPPMTPSPAKNIAAFVAIAGAVLAATSESTAWLEI
jgi:hypothetical protein